MPLNGDKNGTRKWHNINFYQFLPFPHTSNHLIEVEEKLEWSENEMRDKPREPSQKIFGKFTIAHLKFEALAAGGEKTGI